VKNWVLIILLYFFPIFVDLMDLDDQYFHNVLWFFYLIPTIILVYNYGAKLGIFTTGVSSVLFMITELMQNEGNINHELVTIIELTIVNILITIAVGLLVKKNKEKQVQLNETKNRLESIFHNLDIGIWSLNREQSLLISNGTEKLYGLPPSKEERNIQFWKKSIYEADLHILDKINQNWVNQDDYEYEYRITRPNGEIRWIRDRGIPVFNENGDLIRYDGTYVDITKQKELGLKLIESEERYKNLLEKALVGVYLIQNHELVYVNQWFTQIFGLQEKELLGTNFLKYINHKDLRRVFENFQKLADGENTFLIEEVQIRCCHANEVMYLELQAAPTLMNGSPAILGIALDVTDKKKAKTELEYMAYHDSLTGLYNMNYVNDYLLKDFTENQSKEIPVCVMFFNLDRFKFINDSFGHQIGDQVLKIISKRLIDLIRPIGKVVRAGGDDFILYLPNTNPTQAKDIAQFLLQEFKEPVYLEEQEIRLGASIGIATILRDDTLETALKKASSALHLAKEYGRNQYQEYSAEYGELADRRVLLEQGLRKAFERRELELYYQPKLDIFSNQVTGMESLLRWNDVALGSVSPTEFIPIAEETGLIIPIGKWVLEEACRQSKEWHENGYSSIHVCVNISSKQFLQDDFVDMVEQILEETGLPPELLNLEVTEGIALYNVHDAVNKLEQLKQIGVSISLDDFGTGYSSLSYIKSLPIDFLKIDRSFIKDIILNYQDAAIADSIITLAHSLGLKVVAEGVEAHQQLAALEQMGCDEIQGYYFAKPMANHDFAKFLDKKNKPSQSMNSSTPSGA
jgi:diguanylate cyclase (GGDEF)-like protein/PAS domain S-box-containing protein